ncbi:hypothetical protein TNCV_4271471 [Trichonephila clavipes]|nr:hypothetical protein TNCV_4271471 [Trichonephila clavipes]
MIQRYEERPSELEDRCLADFVAWYTPVTKKGRPLGTEVNDDASGDDEPPPDNQEMVTLYLPFMNEAVEILDRNCFLRMYHEREAEIMGKRKEFESNIDIAKMMN